MLSSNTNQLILPKMQKHPDLLQTLTQPEFEQLIAELFVRFGWQIQANESSTDIGCDFAAVSEVEPGLSVTWIVQSKFTRSARPIGMEDLRSLYRSKLDAGVSNAILVTNARFTAGAKSFAESKKDLHLIDHDQVLNWLERSNQL